MRVRSRMLAALSAAVVLLPVAACGAAADSDPVLRVGAIPDQDPQQLQRMYGSVSEYLSEKLDVEVEYVPVTDYTASVIAFQRGDLDLVFFGGLTGVQAANRVPGSVVVAQRDVDAEFRSVFVANTSTDLEPIDGVSDLTALAGHTFTFGSDTSTSGRLMPQYFLAEAGVDLDDFTGQPGFSGSHDKTAKEVEVGSYQVGALSASVWDERVRSGAIDTDKVIEIFRTPTYHDYHWLARPDLDERFDAGFTERVTETLLSIDGSDDVEREILDLFTAGAFIPSEPGNYELIESVARDNGLLR